MGMKRRFAVATMCSCPRLSEEERVPDGLGGEGVGVRVHMDSHDLDYDLDFDLVWLFVHVLFETQATSQDLVQLSSALCM